MLNHYLKVMHSFRFNSWTMVRFKKRYFVVEFERAHHISQAKDYFDIEPLDSKDIDIAEAVKNKVQELHGDFGRASISVGFK